MVRVSVMYPSSGGEAFDAAYYFDKHYALCQSKLTPEGMVSCQFDKGLADGAGGNAPYVAIAHLVFMSVDEFKAAMGKHGREIMGDIKNYTTIKPITQINEIAAG